MREIIKYIEENYGPHTLIVYGSFAAGTNGAQSDFDAIAIRDGGEALHDGERVASVPLDLFVYPTSYFEGDYDAAEFFRIGDGRVLIDKRGLGERLIKRVQARIAAVSPKSEEQKRHGLSWCEKMLGRAERGDAEGYYRWHWLLTDSLEIFFDLNDWRYEGPRKGIEYLRLRAPEAARLYERALREFDYAALADWIACLRAGLK